MEAPALSAIAAETLGVKFVWFLTNLSCNRVSPRKFTCWACKISGHEGQSYASPPNVARNRISNFQALTLGAGVFGRQDLRVVVWSVYRAAHYCADSTVVFFNVWLASRRGAVNTWCLCTSLRRVGLIRLKRPEICDVQSCFGIMNRKSGTILCDAVAVYY